MDSQIGCCFKKMHFSMQGHVRSFHVQQVLFTMVMLLFWKLWTFLFKYINKPCSLLGKTEEKKKYQKTLLLNPSLGDDLDF